MSVPATTPGEPATRGSEADAIAAAVLACQGVIELNAGGVAPVATYLPGRRVTGVRLDEHRIQVSITVARDCKVPQLATQIRASLSPMAAGRPVDLYVADVQTSRSSRRRTDA